MAIAVAKSCRLASTRVLSQPRLKETVTLSGFDRTRQSVFHDKSPSLISTSSRSSYARSIDRNIRLASSIDSATDISKSGPTDINLASASRADTRKYTPCVRSIFWKVLRYDDLRDRASKISFHKYRTSVRRKILPFRKIMRSALVRTVIQSQNVGIYRSLWRSSVRSISASGQEPIMAGEPRDFPFTSKRRPFRLLRRSSAMGHMQPLCMCMIMSPRRADRTAP